VKILHGRGFLARLPITKPVKTATITVKIDCPSESRLAMQYNRIGATAEGRQEMREQADASHRGSDAQQ
jgi:hypothetical protein